MSLTQNPEKQNTITINSNNTKRLIPQGILKHEISSDLNNPKVLASQHDEYMNANPSVDVSLLKCPILAESKINHDAMTTPTDLRCSNTVTVGCFKQEISMPNGATTTDHVYKWGNSHQIFNTDKTLTLEELSRMSQAELIAQVLNAQQKIKQLQTPIKESELLESHWDRMDSLKNFISPENPELPKLIGTITNNPRDISEMLPKTVQDNSNSELTEELKVSTPSTCTEKSSDLHLIESPLITTPPYEYIVLTKENETKFRIYLNPRMDKIFRQEIYNLKNSHSDSKPSVKPLSTTGTGSKDTVGPTHNTSNSCNEKYGNSLSDRVFGTSSGVIHCFDPSDVDLELKKLIMENPPLTHRIVRRKPRKERGSSVPAIDSYYGTQDLAMVGHASYFIPMLTAVERKAIGWKDEYRYGKWKYSTPNIHSSTSGHIPLRPAHSTKVKHSPTHNTNNNNSTFNHHSNHNQSGTLYLDNPDHQVRLSISSQRILSKCHSPCLTEPTQEQLNTIEEDAAELSFISLENHRDSKLSSCHVLKDKRSLKKFLKWLIPCMNFKSKKSSAQDDNYDISSNSSGSEDYEELATTLDDKTTAKAEVKVSQQSHNTTDHPHPHPHVAHHHHHHHNHGCFSLRHSHKTQVTGGDVIDSTKGSLVHVSLPKDKSDFMSSETNNSQNQTSLEIIEARHGDKATVEEMSEEVFEIVYEVSEQFQYNEETVELSEIIINETSGSTLTFKLNQSQSGIIDISETIENRENRDSPSAVLPLTVQEIEPLRSEIFSQTLTQQGLETKMYEASEPTVSGMSDSEELWSTKADYDNDNDEDNFSLISTSEYSDFPFASTSNNTMKNFNSSDNPHDPTIDDDNDDSSTLADIHFLDDIHDEVVYEFDPGYDHDSVPESRFLDPKDFEVSPPHANLGFFHAENLDTEFHNYNQVEDEGDYPDSEDYYNYIPSEDEDDESEYYLNASSWEAKSSTSHAASKTILGLNNNNVNNNSTFY